MEVDNGNEGDSVNMQGMQGKETQSAQMQQADAVAHAILEAEAKAHRDEEGDGNGNSSSQRVNSGRTTPVYSGGGSSSSGKINPRNPYSSFNPQAIATNSDFMSAERMDDFDWPDDSISGQNWFANSIFSAVGSAYRKLSAPLRGVILPLSDEDRKEAVLTEVSIAGIAEKIKSGDIKKIVVLAGAGLSTSAGIPDFRSPGVGLYHRLMEYDIARPEVVLTLEYFRKNPKPFFTLIKTMYPGGVMATKSHFFLKLLADKGLLLRLFTQNIDMLERQSGIDPDLLVEAHGTFARAHCLTCSSECSEQAIRDAAFGGYVPHCDACGGVVKPDIVLFDEPLPLNFFKKRDEDFKDADLLIVMGTSLTVEPFASCIAKVSKYTPRLLINRDNVGRGKWSQGDHFMFGEAENYRDVLMQCSVDDGVEELAKLLGWKEELDTLYDIALAKWKKVHPDAVEASTPKPKPTVDAGSETVLKTRHGSSMLHVFDDGRSPLPLPAEGDADAVLGLVEPFDLMVRVKSQIMEPDLSEGCDGDGDGDVAMPDASSSNDNDTEVHTASVSASTPASAPIDIISNPSQDPLANPTLNLNVGLRSSFSERGVIELTDEQAEMQTRMNKDMGTVK